MEGRFIDRSQCHGVICKELTKLLEKLPATFDIVLSVSLDCFLVSVDASPQYKSDGTDCDPNMESSLDVLCEACLGDAWRRIDMSDDCVPLFH